MARRNSGAPVDQRGQHTAAEADYADPVPTALLGASSQYAMFERLGAIYLMLQDKESRTLSLASQGNNYGRLLALFWLWNILDIAYFRRENQPSRGKNVAGLVSLRFFPAIGCDTAYLALEVRF